MSKRALLKFNANSTKAHSVCLVRLLACDKVLIKEFHYYCYYYLKQFAPDLNLNWIQPVRARVAEKHGGRQFLWSCTAKTCDILLFLCIYFTTVVLFMTHIDRRSSLLDKIWQPIEDWHRRRSFLTAKVDIDCSTAALTLWHDGNV